MSNIMSNMSKKVTAREFLHGFAKLEKELRPGESVTVTRRGEEVGKFVKKAAHSTVRMPDFEKLATLPGISAEQGDKLFARLMADEAIC
jgi:antitoxin (DNA-binding transcriptional repressor) of toxin-antitoxin stability system